MPPLLLFSETAPPRSLSRKRLKLESFRRMIIRPEYGLG